MKKTILLAALFVAMVITGINFAVEDLLKFHDDWTAWKALYFYLVSTSLLFLWICLLLYIHSRIKAHEANKPE